MELGPLQKEWIAALRSGEYKQGKRCLRNFDDKYCCLGVLCAVSNTKVSGRRASGEVVEGRYVFGEELDQETTVLPLSLKRSIKLITQGGSPRRADGLLEINPPDMTWWSLVALNDSGWTFEQIADHLEKYPERYFLEAA